MTGLGTPRSWDAARLELLLSVERLGPYRRAAGGDLDRAVALYQWNSAVAGAFFDVLGHFEVILRNTLDDQLSIWHAAAGRPGAWYDDPEGILDNRRHENIAEARERLQRAEKKETPGRIIAELNFGFWAFLLDRHYQNTLWTPALRHGFPHLIPARRSAVHGPVVRLNAFRNRIAHHEPIHHLDLAGHHSELLQIMGHIDPAAEVWLSGLSRVPHLLPTRPQTPKGQT